MGHYRKTCCTVFPTNACNLACKYCLASHNDGNRPPDQNIDINFAKKGIQDYFSHGFTALRLYSSGEPLMCLDICQESVDFAKSLVGDKLSVEAQSNGVYDDAQLQFANEHIDILWVSLDGFPEINDELRPDKNGKGTTRQVLNTIENLQKEGNTFIGIRATLTEDTMFRQKELIDYFAIDLGVKYIYAEPVFEPVNTEVTDSITNLNIMNYAKVYVEAQNYAKDKGVFWGNNWIINFDEKCVSGCRACNDVPAPHLTTDGYVSCCDLGLYGDTKLQDLIYGKWDKEKGEIIYNKEKLDKITSRRVENMKTCRKCQISDYCAGGCMGMSYFETGDLLGVIPEFCRITRYFAKKIPPGSFDIEHLHP